MLIAYKLLTQNLTSHNDTRWEIGKTKQLPDSGLYPMGSNRVLHCYAHPLLAAFFNPIHANIQQPRLFEIEIDRVVAADGCKQASLQQKLLKEIPLPVLSTEQRIKIAILCVLTIYTEPTFVMWANKWLSGKARTARAASAAASAAAYAAAGAAAYAASAAASAAAYAAYAAYAARATTYIDILSIIQSVITSDQANTGVQPTPDKKRRGKNQQGRS